MIWDSDMKQQGLDPRIVNIDIMEADLLNAYIAFVTYYVCLYANQSGFWEPWVEDGWTVDLLVDSIEIDDSDRAAVQFTFCQVGPGVDYGIKIDEVAMTWTTVEHEMDILDVQASAQRCADELIEVLQRKAIKRLSVIPKIEEEPTT